MTLKNVLSLILLCLFLFSYFYKLYILSKRNHIQGNMLTKSVQSKDNKTRLAELLVKTTSILWIMSWIAEILFEIPIQTLSPFHFSTPFFTGLGLSIISIGLTIFITAMVFMKTSWRVGIDKQTKTTLVSDGLYKFSRNPAFVGFDLMFLGLFLAYMNSYTLLILTANLIAFHLLILQEEKHLQACFSKEYLEYKKNTPRYIFF